MTTNQQTSERGSVLALSLVVVVLMTGIGLAFSSLLLHQNRNSRDANHSIGVQYAAESGLEVAYYLIEENRDPIVGNIWLGPASIPAAGLDPRRPSSADEANIAWSGLVGDIPVDLFVYSLDNTAQKYRLLSRAVHPSYKTAVILAQDVRAWDTFAKYATFVDAESLNYGTTKVDGAVHSNRRINFHFGGAQFTERISAVHGFYYYNGATAGNTSTPLGEPRVPAIAMPGIGELAALRDDAAGGLDVHSANATYSSGADVDAELVFNGDQVEIRGISQADGTVISQGTYTLPDNAVIFVQGNVRSVEGTMSKRATVVSMGEINITGRITYVDAAGTPAYQLTQNGTPVANNDTPPGTAWTAANGYDYVANPSYVPDPASPPSLGLMSAGKISIDSAAPHNMEIHASLFSVNSRWEADLTTVKGNLRMVGSSSTKLAGVRAQGNSPSDYLAGGYVESGGYVYDRNLLDAPPPKWLKVTQPSWGPRWKADQR